MSKLSFRADLEALLEAADAVTRVDLPHHTLADPAMMIDHVVDLDPAPSHRPSIESSVILEIAKIPADPVVLASSTSVDAPLKMNSVAFLSATAV